jgi:hypothetical protein
MTSQINPNNINGAYPVAGQDNNSQGFRDNFTNTGTNFQYAANEITDLQNKVIVSAPLTNGGNLLVQNDMLNSPLINALVSDFAFATAALGTLSGTATIDYTAGHFQTVTTGAPISLNFTNWPIAGQTGVISVQVTVNNLAYTLTLPTAVGTGAAAQSAVGIQGLNTITNVLTFAEIGTYTFTFTTSDGGTTIYISDDTRPRNYFMNDVTIGNTANSTSTTTGALVVAGGTGIVGNLYVGGTIFGISNVIVSSANTANTANTAGYVTGNAQGNITSVGTLVLLDVTGNIGTSSNFSATGNVIGGLVLSNTNVSATGNVFAGADISAGGNVIGSIVTGSVTNTGLEFVSPVFQTVGAAPSTVTLSSTTTVNILDNTGTSQTTINPPASPADGQVTSFSIYGTNPANLLVGTGTWQPSFTSTSVAVGTVFKYVYQTSGGTWFKIA